LTNRVRLDQHAVVFWPYRPRPDHPSVPRWLMILILVAVTALYVGLLSLLTHEPTYGPMP
jgi:hypothetical protein